MSAVVTTPSTACTINETIDPPSRSPAGNVSGLTSLCQQ
jgi:hypothetical protein